MLVAAVQGQGTSMSKEDTVARGLPQLFTPGLLEELTAEDPFLEPTVQGGKE